MAWSSIAAIENRTSNIINEEIEMAENESRLGAGSISTSAAKKSFRDTGTDLSDPEVTPKERQILDQMKNMLQKGHMKILNLPKI